MTDLLHGVFGEYNLTSRHEGFLHNNLRETKAISLTSLLPSLHATSSKLIEIDAMILCSDIHIQAFQVLIIYDLKK